MTFSTLHRDFVTLRLSQRADMISVTPLSHPAQAKGRQPYSSIHPSFKFLKFSSSAFQFVLKTPNPSRCFVRQLLSCQCYPVTLLPVISMKSEIYHPKGTWKDAFIIIDRPKVQTNPCGVLWQSKWTGRKVLLAGMI